MNDDIHFAYNVLAQAFCNKPYIQHEFWGISRGFKPNPILEFIIDEIPNKSQTRDEGNTISSVSATL